MQRTGAIFRVDLLSKTKDSERSLFTTDNAIQTDFDGVRNVLVCTTPGRFAIRLYNNSNETVAAYVTIDGKPTMVGDGLQRAYILSGKESQIVYGFEDGSSVSDFMFQNTTIAQDEESISNVNKSVLGTIHIRFCRASSQGFAQVRMDLTNVASRNRIALKESDTKTFGLLTTIGNSYGRYTYDMAEWFRVEPGTLNEINISYRNEIGMIMALNEPKWKQVDSSQLKWYKPPVRHEMDESTDVVEIEPPAYYVERKKAVLLLEKWNPKDVAMWLSLDQDLKQYQEIFELLQVDGAILTRMTDAALRRDLLVKPELHRKKILYKIEKLIAKIC